HQYRDNRPGNAPFTISVTLTDGYTEVAATTEVTVLNLSPQDLTIGGPATGLEGTAIELTGSASDPGRDPLFFAWSVTKNGSPYATGNGTGFGFVPDDNGSYVVTLTVTDDEGATSETSDTIDVGNVAPQELSIAGPGEAVRGQTLQFAGRFADAGSA